MVPSNQRFKNEMLDVRESSSLSPESAEALMVFEHNLSWLAEHSCQPLVSTTLPEISDGSTKAS
jgi:hypothetical protein